MGAYSSPSTAKEWGSSDQVPTRGQAPPSMAEVSKVVGLKLCPSHITVFKNPLRRGCLGTEGDEDSLHTNSELAAEAVSSILRDSDLKRANAIFVERLTEEFHGLRGDL